MQVHVPCPLTAFESRKRHRRVRIGTLKSVKNHRLTGRSIAGSTSFANGYNNDNQSHVGLIALKGKRKPLLDLKYKLSNG